MHEPVFAETMQNQNRGTRSRRNDSGAPHFRPPADSPTVPRLCENHRATRATIGCDRGRPLCRCSQMATHCSRSRLVASHASQHSTSSGHRAVGRWRGGVLDAKSHRSLSRGQDAFLGTGAPPRISLYQVARKRRLLNARARHRTTSPGRSAENARTRRPPCALLDSLHQP